MAADSHESQGKIGIRVDIEATEGLRAQMQSASIRRRVRRLGIHSIPGSETSAGFGFYLPQAVEAELVVYRSEEPIDPAVRSGHALCTRCTYPLVLQDDFAWLVLNGIRFGTRDLTGDLYWVQARMTEGGTIRTIRDFLGHSVPFGAAGPAEMYELKWPGRRDTEYFRRRVEEATVDDRVGIPRLDGPCAILQIHVGTATAEGSFAGLTRVFAGIAEKISHGEELTAFEKSISSYDAVQLMPVEPIIEYEGGDGFWSETLLEDGRVRVQHSRPDMTNWGYDIMTVASPAVNPCLLSTGRPDEFIDFLQTMHEFPGGGIQIILDIVYGHADNQSRELLLDECIAGPGMYGQVLNYRHPVVREILLEMQRRKSCYGIDGLRVDGAQDFKYFDPDIQQLQHDDDYLRRMNDQAVEVDGIEYLPWMIFEDGRPWPDDDWELSSTYLEVTRQLPNVLQWGPLTFAHNTPFLYTFWAQKWWRVRESFYHGDHWITGCANHDTLRRGTQVDPQQRINSRLGADHREIFRRGYNNPAAQLLGYAAMPGVPMDFLQANIGAPWSFIRNTDRRWSIKVVSEESRFLTWAVDDASYAQSEFFIRLKGFGFVTLESLRSFAHHLNLSMQAAEYHEETAVQIMDAALPNSPLSPHTTRDLRAFSRAWMDDLHEYCNASFWAHKADPVQAEFHKQLREHRQQSPFLSDRLNPDYETVFYLEPAGGSMVYCVLRQHRQTRTSMLIAANMEGKTVTLSAESILQDASGRLPEGAMSSGMLTAGSWRLLLQTPGAICGRSGDEPIQLADSEGVVLLYRPQD
ncbi:MAG: glucosylglycerol hydrolase [Spirochaeta sp.]